MFSHLMIGSNDVERSTAFYDVLFAVLGARPGFADPKGRVVYRHNKALFMISRPIDGEPATVSNGATIGFAMTSPEEVDAWHRAGVEAGGVSIEDPPGPRQGAFGPLYLAYLRDPDGHKLCGVYRAPRSRPE